MQAHVQREQRGCVEALCLNRILCAASCLHFCAASNQVFKINLTLCP